MIKLQGNYFIAEGRIVMPSAKKNVKLKVNLIPFLMTPDDCI